MNASWGACVQALICNNNILSVYEKEIRRFTKKVNFIENMADNSVLVLESFNSYINNIKTMPTQSYNESNV